MTCASQTVSHKKDVLFYSVLFHKIDPMWDGKINYGCEFHVMIVASCHWFESETFVAYYLPLFLPCLLLFATVSCPVKANGNDTAGHVTCLSAYQLWLLRPVLCTLATLLSPHLKHNLDCEIQFAEFVKTQPSKSL